MPDRHTRLAACAVVLLLLAGCTGDDDTSESVERAEPGTDLAAEPLEDADDPDPDEPDDEVDDDDGDQRAEEEPDTSGPPHGSITLSGVQQIHPTGAVIAVTGITIDDHGDFYVEFETQNVNQGQIGLATHGLRLFDDVGNGYRRMYAGNRSLLIPSDHGAEVSLAFEGPIDPAATRLSLGFNTRDELLDPDASPPHSTYPTFAFRDLPLPGVGLGDGAGDPDTPIGIDLPEASVTVDDAVYVGEVTDLTIEVREIRVTPLVTQVDVYARNDGGRDRNIIVREPLLWAEGTGSNLRYATLRSEDGSRDTMAIDPGEELHATLSFRGSVPPEATGLRFGLGAVWGSDMRAGFGEDNSLYPVAVFTGLPLPEDADDQAPTVHADDGSAANDVDPSDERRADEPSQDPDLSDEGPEEREPPVTTIRLFPVDAPETTAEVRVGELIIEFDGELTDEGTLLTLEEPILFAFDSAQLKGGARTTLDDITEVLDHYPGAPIEVIGHTDDRGSVAYNLDLSQRRADAVVTALIDRGIDAGRVTADGRGLTEPVASNDTDEGRATNRRVEVLIVGVEPPEPSGPAG